MRPELAALVDWLRSSDRMAHVHYGRLLREVQQTLERTLFMINGSTDSDAEGLASAIRTTEMHLEAAVVDHDPAALAFLLEGLIPLARFVGDNPLRLLVAIGVLTDEEILDGVDEVARRNPPPPA
jgi:hypothetical protein